MEGFFHVADRSLLPSRRGHDLYPTEPTLPPVACPAILPEVAPTASRLRILDPGAGESCIWGLAAKEFLSEFYDVCVTGLDLRDISRPDGVDTWYKSTHYLRFPAHPEMNGLHKYDVIIGNPPFGPQVGGKSMIEWFIRHSYDNLLAENGILAFLARQAFASGQKRYRSFFPSYPIYQEYRLSTRPSFYKSAMGSSTALTDYSIFVWKKDYQPENVHRWECRHLLHPRYNYEDG